MELNDSAQQSSNGTEQTTNEPFNQQSLSESNNRDVAQAMAELDSMEKFKFQGREWSPKDLEKAIMRQKDYTSKTQSLSEERKNFESERKFYDNLHYDLKAVVNNPQLASEFVKVYPEKFHSFLKEVLSSNPRQQASQQNQQQIPQPDFETLTRLGKLEGILHEQEVAKNTVEITNQIESLSKKYPDALPDVAIARIHEAYNGQKASPEAWEKAFKASDDQIKSLLKNRYGDLVKKQTSVNTKARDVAAGGGTPGRAPEKFKSLKEVSDYAIRDLTRK